jgi:hypothetical protein
MYAAPYGICVAAASLLLLFRTPWCEVQRTVTYLGQIRHMLPGDKHTVWLGKSGILLLLSLCY